MSDADPKTPQEVIAEAPSGARPYVPGDVAKRPQGPRSTGQSEPGDMGAFDNEEYRHDKAKGDSEGGYRGG